MNPMNEHESDSENETHASAQADADKGADASAEASAHKSAGAAPISSEGPKQAPPPNAKTGPIPTPAEPRAEQPMMTYPAPDVAPVTEELAAIHHTATQPPATQPPATGASDSWPRPPSEQPTPIGAIRAERAGEGFLREAAWRSPRIWPDFATPLRGVDLLYLLGFYFLAGAVLTVVVAGGAMLVFHFSAATLQKSTVGRANVMILSQGLLSGATLIFLYAVVRSRSGAPFWNALGWRSLRLSAHRGSSQMATILQYVLGGFALAITVGWLSRFFSQDTALPMEDLFKSRQSVLLLMALGILVAPVVEETIFRGCIFPVLARKLGIRGGIVVTGVLFGVAHAQQLWGGWGEIALLICVGIVLTYVRARAGTVAASYLVHVSYNTILFGGFYFATHGLRYFPPS